MCVRYISMVPGGVPEPSSSADLPANIRTKSIHFPEDNYII